MDNDKLLNSIKVLGGQKLEQTITET